MKKNTIAMITSICLLSALAEAQNILPKSGRVGIFTTYPNASAALDIDTTGLGLLIPRMNKDQRDAISSPATGLLIYQTSNTPGFYYFDGSVWAPVTPKGANRSLNNLTSPTALNQHLLPGNDTLNLGDTNKAWGKLFLTDGLYNASSRLFKADSTNTAAGINTLGVTMGKFNTATGSNALHSNTGGVLNTAVGASALYYNTAGSGNTATGVDALYTNNTGSFNTASGYFALALNTTASNNVAYGDYALYSNTTGHSNIAIGSKALYKNINSSNLVAIGDSALLNTSGSYYNVAVGSKALLNNTVGSLNSAFGFEALNNNITGYYNTAVGYSSLFLNEDGKDNTAIGNAALYHNEKGNYNTAIGAHSLNDNMEGHWNSALGYYAGVIDYNLSNATVIGAGAMVDASYKVRIGNTSITSIGGQVGWTTFSDGRYKKNIKENVPGLAFINALRPVSYTVDVTSLNNYFKAGNQNDSSKNARAKEADAILKEGYDKAARIRHTGLIAQEVEAAANKLGYDFSGIDKPENKDKVYGLRYDEFVVPLVKAVQELSKQNDSLQQQNKAQQKINADLENKYRAQQKAIEELTAIILGNQTNTSSTSNIKLTGLTVGQETSNNVDAFLSQNTPNPFSHSTTINYELPQQFTSAQIIVTDHVGKTIRIVKISGGSKGSMKLDASMVPSGAYHYSLFVDGKLIASRQMEHRK